MGACSNAWRRPYGRGTGPTGRAALAAVIGCLLFAAGAQARPHYHLSVHIDPATHLARGAMVLDVDNTSAAALPALELWLYPERLGRRSPALDEHNFYWLYPRSFDPGAIALGDIRVDGVPALVERRDVLPAGPGTLLVVPLARPLAPGGRVRLSLAFTTRIPKRYGAFGCYRRRCTLSGGFHPMLLGLDAQGFDRTAPPALADYTLQVSAPPGAEVIIGGERRAQAVLDSAPHALVMVDALPGLTEQRLVYRQATLSYLHHGKPTPPVPESSAAPFVLEDRAPLVLAVARDALDLLAELGLTVPPGTTLRLCEVPLRMELAVAQEGAVLISDQMFRIGPLQRFRKFHAFQLARAIFNALVEQRLRSREMPQDLGWSPDAVASWLVDLYTVRAYRKAEFAKDVLRAVSFIPTIDRLIYAPQIQFASAYFNTLDDPDPTRDDLRRFANTRPRGKLIYEKLRDLLGDEKTSQVMRAVWAGTPLREAVAAHHDGPLTRFFAQWLGRYPEVDYQVALASVERLDGRSDARWRYRLRVFKRGARPPEEPVEIRVNAWGGEDHQLTWDGQGRAQVLMVETRRPIRSIILDPRGRLLERRSGANDDLRLNNRLPGRWKFIYNDLGALFSAQTASLDLSIDFSLSRVYDVKNQTRFLLFRNRTAQAGLLVSYSRGLGRLITPARLEAALTSTLRVVRLQPAFGLAGTRPAPGTQVSLGLTYARDDRLFVWEPWRSTFFGGGLNYALTILDDGRVLNQVTTSASFGRIVPIIEGHGVAFELSWAATFGNLLVPSQLLAAGAPNFVRGYEPDELLGRLRLFGRGEYRHVFIHDLNLNFLHIAYIRAISGAVFVEGAAISPCEGYRIGTRDLFGDVGYSLRFQADWLGVVQTTLNIDVAVPLVRRRRGCLETDPQNVRDPATRAPVGFFIYFGPVF